MELPASLPPGQEQRRILGEFYDGNKNKQWFFRAEYVINHPKNLKDTLEIYCTYNPLLEMKEILTFAHHYQIAVEIIDLSHRDRT